MKLAPVRKRIALLVSTAVVVGMALTGCAGSGSSASSTGGVAEITYADGLFANPRSGPMLTALLNDFNASHPDIHVTQASVPFPTFAQTILTQLSAGEGPDVIRFDTPDFFQAAKAKLLTPLDSVIDANALQLLPRNDKYTSVNGTRYGIVSTAGSYTLLYNKDLVPNPPTTFAQFEQTAKDLTKGDQYGLAFRTTLPEANGMWQDLWNYVYGFGGAWSDGTNLTLNSPDTVKGLEMYQQLYNDNVIPAGATASTYRQMFADGKVAMEIDNGGTADNLKTLNPNLNLGAVQIPFPVQSTGEVVAVTGINAASKNTAASETFIKWLLEPAQQVRILNVSGTGGSVATAAVPTPDMVMAQPLQPVFNASTAVALPQIVLGFEDKTPDIRKIVVQQVIAALQGQMTMQQAMDQAQQQATQAVG